jgi:hypothetical protein
MNIKELAELGRNAHAWAKAYTALKGALVREGVVEEEAKAEARNAANFAALYSFDEDGRACPLCGRGE